MRYQLRLYITGTSATSKLAIHNLRAICGKLSGTSLSDQYDVEIIDVLEDPQIAERDKIMVTPTLVKNLPRPIRKIIGDLSDFEQVLIGFGLIPTAPWSDAPIPSGRLIIGGGAGKEGLAVA